MTVGHVPGDIGSFKDGMGAGEMCAKGYCLVVGTSEDI
jgi:hypothetical protein